MAPPAAEDLIEALAACLREHVEERKRELAHTKPIPPGVGASYDDHWNELERRGFTVRKAELERWLQEVEES